MYQKFVKPLFFMMDPETAHNFILYLGRFLSFTKMSRIFRPLFVFRDGSLENDVLGVHFDNPVGLAGGFDKNGYLTDFFPDIGFGFMEVGSVTAHAYGGNPQPRLYRLIKNKSLIVNYGLMNQGADVVNGRLKNKNFRIPIIVNVAKTNDATIKGNASVNDYVSGFSKMRAVSGIFVINISCPNAGDGRSFEDPVLLEKLLIVLSKKRNRAKLLLKISPDVEKSNLDKIILLAQKYGVNGFVISNLTKNRKGLVKENGLGLKGGVSGPILAKKSNKIISYVFKKTQGRFTIIGCGGISNAKDAYEKIKCGASLIELITGMIYYGPGLIKTINYGLAELLKRDGYTNVKEAVGAAVR